MRRCKFCKSKLSDVDAVCQFCGDEEFILVEEDEPPTAQFTPTTPKVVVALNQDESRQRNACCPNPDCAETLVPVHERYCPRCDNLLELVSKDLWITKVVKPELQAHTAEILKDPLRLLTSAEEIGLEATEAEKALSHFFVELSGKNHHVIRRWVNSSVLPFFRMNLRDESARRCAVTDAESEDINVEFAEYAVEKLFSFGKNRANFFAETKTSLSNPKTEMQTGNRETKQSSEIKTKKQIHTFEDTQPTQKNKGSLFLLIGIISLLVFTIYVAVKLFL